MNIPAEFDEIRPYTPEELPAVFKELLADPSFQKAVATVMPDVPIDGVALLLQQCKTNLDVQKNICYKLLKGIIANHSDGVTMDPAALQNHNCRYTFISNHRDIVLDSGFLSVMLIEMGFPTTVEIAIGDNLLIYPWIKKFVRVNKSFIVQRALTMRQMLESSALMSRYIHFAVTQKQENIWIAQREGRAKDSNDRTQESVLKMLAMGGSGDVIDCLKELNLMPLSISYEYDPCDYLKAQEMQLKRDIEGYKKTQQDDLINMQTGLFGYKGKVHFHPATCINEEIEALRGLPKTEIFTQIARIIDKHIHSNYRLYPGNYVALDLMNHTEQYTAQYTAEEKERFEKYLQEQIGKIEIPSKDESFLRECILKMYANPVINYLKAVQE